MMLESDGCWFIKPVFYVQLEFNLWKSTIVLNNEIQVVTRLHSSRMRTARVLTVSLSMLCGRGCTWSRGVYLVPGGVPGPGGCTWSRGCTWSGGVYLVPGGVPGPGGCTWSGDVPGLGGVPGPDGGGVTGPGGSGTPPCEQNHTHL